MDYDLKTKPDFGEMPMAWLIKANNLMVREIAECGLDGHREVKQFHDRSAGVKRCESTWSSLTCARANKVAVEAEQKKPAKQSVTLEELGGTDVGEANAASWAPVLPKKREPRKSSGKPAKSVAEHRTVRDGTARAKILYLMTNGEWSVNDIAREVGLDGAKVAAHLYCTWRDCGVGYSITDGKVKALYPEGHSYETTVVT